MCHRVCCTERLSSWCANARTSASRQASRCFANSSSVPAYRQRASSWVARIRSSVSGRDRVAVLEEAAERRSGRLQQVELVQPAGQTDLVAVADHVGRPSERAARERVRVRLAVDHDALPGPLGHPGLGSARRGGGVQEVPRVAERERLERLAGMLERERAGRAPHRVGRQDRRVVALGVDLLEIALQAHLDLALGELVTLLAAHHGGEVDPRLAVPVVPSSNPISSPGTSSSRTG
jgi:hypothetical protein